MCVNNGVIMFIFWLAGWNDSGSQVTQLWNRTGCQVGNSIRFDWRKPWRALKSIWRYEIHLGLFSGGPRVHVHHDTKNVGIYETIWWCTWKRIWFRGLSGRRWGRQMATKEYGNGKTPHITIVYVFAVLCDLRLGPMSLCFDNW